MKRLFLLIKSIKFLFISDQNFIFCFSNNNNNNNNNNNYVRYLRS